MKTPTIAAASILALFATSSGSFGATIFSDSFTATDGTAISGKTVEVSNRLGNETYAKHNVSWIVDITGNRIRVGADSAASLAITTSGTFTQPTMMRLSATVNLGTLSGGTSSANTGLQRGAGLGFYDTAGGSAGATNWRGLFLGNDGRLILGQTGANSAGTGIGFVAEIATGLTVGSDHTLSYQIDTTTGDISNIFLDSVLQADLTTTFFNADVNRVGMTSSSAAGNTYSFFDDFKLESVPEPSSVALLGIFGGLALLRRRR